jgi:hypothetical protein
MSRHLKRRPAVDPDAWEGEFQRRLHRGKTRLLIQDALFFVLAAVVIFFVI